MRQTDVEGAYGFLYLIQNLEFDRKYVGSKSLVSGSDWHSYWGSSNMLKQDIKLLGEDCFSRTILEFSYTKKELRKLEKQWLFGITDWNRYYNDKRCLKYYGCRKKN